MIDTRFEDFFRMVAAQLQPTRAKEILKDWGKPVPFSPSGKKKAQKQKAVPAVVDIASRDS